jgi:hypothetical protein
MKIKSKLFIPIFIFIFSASANAINLKGAEDWSSENTENASSVQCEAALQSLESASGITIQNPAVRRRLLNWMKAQPELLLLNLMAQKASSASCGAEAMDSVANAVIEDLEKQMTTEVPEAGKSKSGPPREAPRSDGKNPGWRAMRLRW